MYFGRVEQSVYALLRTRDMAISRYREFGIPVDWLLDSGVVGKVCFKLKEKVLFELIVELVLKCCLIYLTLLGVIWIMELAMFGVQDVMADWK